MGQLALLVEVKLSGKSDLDLVEQASCLPLELVDAIPKLIRRLGPLWEVVVFQVEELVLVAVVLPCPGDVVHLGAGALASGFGADGCVKVVDGQGSNSGR